MRLPCNPFEYPDFIPIRDFITVDIDVQSGSSGIETPRSSTAVGTAQPEAIALAENFSFQLLDYFA